MRFAAIFVLHLRVLSEFGGWPGSHAA